MLEKTGAKDDTEILDLDFRTRWEQKPERDRERKRQKEGGREGEKEWMGKPTANCKNGEASEKRVLQWASSPNTTQSYETVLSVTGPRQVQLQPRSSVRLQSLYSQEVKNMGSESNMSGFFT